jgi:hypothetical protein
MKVVDIKEKDLIELGFRKEESQDTVDGMPTFYYYSHGKHGLLISSANDELINGMYWYVEILEYPEYKPITDLDTLKELVAILNKISK